MLSHLRLAIIEAVILGASLGIWITQEALPDPPSLESRLYPDPRTETSAATDGTNVSHSGNL